MDRALSGREEREVTVEYQPEFKHNAFLKQGRAPSSRKPKRPFSVVKFWVSKSLRNLSSRAKVSKGFEKRSFSFNGMVINNTVYGASPGIFDDKMESFLGKSEEMGDKNEGECENECGVEGFRDEHREETGESSSSSDFLASEVTVNDEHSSSEDSSSPPSMVWPIQKNEESNFASSSVCQDLEKPHSDKRKLEKQGSSLPGTNSEEIPLALLTLYA